MKLIRWLLSNIILIAFVLALTYAYVYWDNLTGEDTPAGKVIAYLSTEYDEVREFLDSYDLGGGDAGDVAEPEAAEPEPAPKVAQTASVPQVQTPPAPQRRPPVQQPAPPQAAVMQPPAREPVRQPAVERDMPQEPAAPAQVPATAAKDETQQAGQPAKTTRELWISAREEYHRGNIEASINNYKEVIANSTDNFDAYGELGNVYLNTGNTREAANAYFEAAAILVKMGQIRRASSLLPMLGRLDRNKAEELNQLINKSNT
ncbi:MAG: tetratricopeptide repeat protein [Gammaproteobacteria bacterium]|jgi:outer membrane biosynthesis protein TonB